MSTKISPSTWIPLGSLVLVVIVTLWVGQIAFQTEANAKDLNEFKIEAKQVRADDRKEILQNLKDLNDKFDRWIFRKGR